MVDGFKRHHHFKNLQSPKGPSYPITKRVVVLTTTKILSSRKGMREDGITFYKNQSMQRYGERTIYTSWITFSTNILVLNFVERMKLSNQYHVIINQFIKESIIHKAWWRLCQEGYSTMQLRGRKLSLHNELLSQITIFF